MTRSGLALLTAAMVALLAPARADMPVFVGGTVLNLQTRSMVDMRFKSIVRQGYDLSCGAAALATLLKYYYDEDVTEQDVITEAMRVGDADKIQNAGFSMLELKKVGEARGYQSGGFHVDDVEKLRKLEVPAVTIVNNRGYNHFVVIKGVSGNTVFLADPAFGNRSRPLPDFANEWNNVILVFLTEGHDGNGGFTLDPTLRTPGQQLMAIFDHGLVNIRPGAGEF